MDEKPYHHGDLRNALIEAGIALINEKGVEQFSLRKVAVACGVSHTAPYAHFKDVGALMAAMSEHVTSQLMGRFRSAMDGQGPQLLTMLGKAYVAFFVDHPNYFQFLFYNSGLTIDIDNDEGIDYPAFALFREATYQMCKERGIPAEQWKHRLLEMWSLVHGITALSTNKNIKYSGDWLDIV